MKPEASRRCSQERRLTKWGGLSFCPIFLAGALMTTSPTFVAEFENGDSVVVTRDHRPHAGVEKKPNMVRGVRLARAAYELRIKKLRRRSFPGDDQFDGEIIETYTRELLDAVP